MTTQAILAQEASNEHSIYFHLEGNFWKCYEQSAFLFTQNICPYQVKKKFIKVVGQYVCSVGFPAISRENVENICIEKGWELHTVSEKEIEMQQPDEKIEADTFKSWKEGIPVFLNTTPTGGVLQNMLTQVYTPSPSVPDKPSDLSLPERIRAFSIANSTPMECMLFLSELQRIL